MGKTPLQIVRSIVFIATETLAQPNVVSSARDALCVFFYIYLSLFQIMAVLRVASIHMHGSNVMSS